MAIKDLLVAYDGNDASKKALQFAVQMARKYRAAVTGVHVFRPEAYESHVRRWIPEETLKSLHAAALEVEGAIETSFRAEIAESGFDGEIKWFTAEGQANIILPRIARYFDILLVGQFTTHFGHEGRTVSPEELAIRAGGPLIVVPTGLEVRPFKEQAAVAWDGSRSAARALTDAMQILETKRRLDVVTVDGNSDLGAIPEGIDIVEHLQRHDIAARRVVLDRQHASIGETIVHYCDETGPDLLVLGAFGRGKFGNLLFGGVTKYILEHMTVPVLLSH
jgi:nucleotide-binding universal stress UspA family protein